MTDERSPPARDALHPPRNDPDYDISLEPIATGGCVTVDKGLRNLAFLSKICVLAEHYLNLSMSVSTVMMPMSAYMQ